VQTCALPIFIQVSDCRFFGSAYDCDEAAAVSSIRNDDDLASLAEDEGVALRISTTFWSMLTSKCKRGAGRTLLATADENICNAHLRPAFAHGSCRSDGNDI